MIAKTVKQEVVVALYQNPRSKIATQLHVYHLMDSVSLDNPVEITDRPAINLVEVQSNRLMSRTLTFRIRAAAGVFNIVKEWGTGSDTIYQSDRTAGAEGAQIDEAAMQEQLTRLKAMRNRFVSVYSVVESNFYGIVQDIRLTADNKSRTIVGAEVIVREVLGGSRIDSHFDYLPAIPVDPATGNAIRKPSSDITVSAIRITTIPGVDLHSARQTIQTTDVRSLSQIVGATDYDAVADGFDVLDFGDRGNFRPTSAWILKNFSSQTSLESVFNLNTSIDGLPINLQIDLNSGGDTPRWECAVGSNAAQELAPFTPIFIDVDSPPPNETTFSSIDSRGGRKYKLMIWLQDSQAKFAVNPKYPSQAAINFFNSPFNVFHTTLKTSNIPPKVLVVRDTSSAVAGARVILGHTLFPSLIDTNPIDPHAAPFIGEIGARYSIIVVVGVL